MNYQEAQQELANAIVRAAETTKPYFWKLSGDDPNSICRFLDISEEELKRLLRLCRIYYGDSDKLSKDNFELLMTRCGCLDWTTYRPFGGKTERFIKIGNQPHPDEVILPKSMYGSDGNLLAIAYPVQDEHFRNIRTKSQKGTVTQLLELASAVQDIPQPMKHDGKPKQLKDLSPKSLLLLFVSELVSEASVTGSSKISTRSLRKLRRLFDASVDVEAKDLLHASVEKMSWVGASSTLVNTDNGGTDATTSDLVSPVKVGSTLIQTVTPPTDVSVLITQNAEEDVELLLEDETSVSTVDEFIAELQEEVLLQSLLLKRIHEKKERVFTLEHRNGRRLLVVLPPDTVTVATFEEEARRSGWVDTMLNTDERVRGMLTYISKTSPTTFTDVAQKRKLLKSVNVLSTAQTVALARVGNLNDTRLKNVRSFLSMIGKVNLQYSTKEIKRLDEAVCMNRTSKVTFGSTVHEWSKNKGKEKKPPEEVEYWNASLLSEIEAEVDIHLKEVLAETESIESIPTIDYMADGFSQAGITFLVGGDHGDKNCPISAKLNLSSPQKRKQNGNKLSMQCPVVQFASVRCSKDAYDLMDSTVMPAIKSELNQLKKSSILTVFHTKNITGCFRSYTVPSSILLNTVAFRSNQDVPSTTMTFAYYYGLAGDRLEFGSISLKEPFNDVPYFELATVMTVSRFNELFIGDLAFLAMLIGMNNSSGTHCLLCMKSKAEFNCNHQSLVPRTKESLRECLEQYLLLVQNSTSAKPPANSKGVNSQGLLDVDPQRIVIPILHCPMGLVDKILESFKAWVNLDVEDFRDEAMETKRSVYKLARITRQQAINSHQQAKTLAVANPGSAEAKSLEKETNNARINAKKEESKARAQYEEQVQIHNALKTSLCQKFESIYSGNGIKREHYHGGKFNGVNCIRIMGKSATLFLGMEQQSFLQECLSNKTESIAPESVTDKCQQYSRLLGLLDTIWSSVRGKEAGLLPTDEQLDRLEQALSECRQLWLSMGLTTNQPKWHLTFDGHLLAQVKRFGGLADKADDTIEKFHQVLKELRGRFKGTRSYQQRENCIRRELRRRRCHEISTHIVKYEAKIKRSSTSKRKQDTQAREQERRETKKARRDAAVAG